MNSKARNYYDAVCAHGHVIVMSNYVMSNLLWVCIKYAISMVRPKSRIEDSVRLKSRIKNRVRLKSSFQNSVRTIEIRTRSVEPCAVDAALVFINGMNLQLRTQGALLVGRRRIWPLSREEALSCS